MSLKEEEEIEERENVLFRMGDSLFDLRCEHLFIFRNKCVKID